MISLHQIQALKTEDALIDAYQAFAAEIGHPTLCAEELVYQLLCDEPRNNPQIDVIHAFIGRFEAVSA
jgi:hypothetical protein